MTQHGSTGATPTYQGRALPRPTEDVEDQGLAFDVTTLLGRRQALRLLGAGALGLGVAACAGGGTGSSGTSSSTAAGSGTATGGSTGTTAAVSTEIPDETAGPYPADGSNGPDVLESSGVLRSDLRSSFAGSSGTAQGVPMTLELALSDLADGGSALAGAAVYVWHCDREGRYSLYTDGVTDQNYLRGVQVADADGLVRFTSVVPGCYDGRWPHIHFEVYPDAGSITEASNAIATSQVALPQRMCETVYAEPGYESSVQSLAGVSLEGDGVFGDDGGVTQLATVTGDVTAGYTVRLPVRVDTRTEPAVGRQPRSGGGAPGGLGRPSGGPPGRS